jgi:hypothetical protein
MAGRFTAIELLVMILSVVAVFSVSDKPPREHVSLCRAKGGLSAYAVAQENFRDTYNTYGALSLLAKKTGLDSMIARANSPKTTTTYAGYWFDDAFSGVNFQSDYQCVITPRDKNVGSHIYLTNASGNIYVREITTVPQHGVIAKVSQAELDDPEKWTKSATVTASKRKSMMPTRTAWIIGIAVALGLGLLIYRRQQMKSQDSLRQEAHA